jgi:hypothetical protein
LSLSLQIVMPNSNPLMGSGIDGGDGDGGVAERAFPK